MSGSPTTPLVIAVASILDNAAVRNAALPISVEQYHRLGETGIIPQNTELLHGVIVEKMVKSPEHSWLVQRLADWLRSNLPSDCHLRQVQPLTFVDSEPEPDLAVVRGQPDDFRRQHPRTAEWVIEVAISSEDIDRQKGQVYAEAGVGEYWLVLPQLRAIEFYRSPAGGHYGQSGVVRPAERLAPAFFTAELELSQLFQP
jgi:Uma2 family endonuclease